MSLSSAEIKSARKARLEIKEVKDRKRFWILNGMWLTTAVIQCAIHNEKWIKFFWIGFLLVTVGACAYRWSCFRCLESRYEKNLDLLRVLGEREPGLIEHLEVTQGYRPLLEACSQRLNQRALLWRVDHFLSGKGFAVNSNDD